MGKDVSDVIGTALGNTTREALQNVSKSARKRLKGSLPGGPKGVAAGAAGLGLMALAPLAAKGAGKLVSGAADKGTGKLKDAGDKLGSNVKKKVKGDLVDGLPGSGLFSKSGDSDGTPGVGKARRMPVQQDLDIGVPISTVYNQWTQFEEWPNFMHRITSVSQDDDTHVKFKTKIWGKTKEFTAEIEEQRPDERIKWRVTEGVSHCGVVTFHEIGPRLTRVELNLDIEPGSLIEKAARGMRHVKRAVRADMARFKAYVLMEEDESGAWRGRVENGDVKSSSSRGNRSRASSGKSRSSSGSSRASSGSSRAPSGSSRASSGSSRAPSGSSRASSSRRPRGATNGDGTASRSSGRAASSRRRSGSHS
jgi:uncharacterized membrane protein